MVFNKSMIFGVQLNEHHVPASPQHIFASVVLIDQSHVALPSVLYQLNNDTVIPMENFSTIRQGFQPDLHDAFMFMGEVISINKEKKQVSLSGDNTVSYQHLIIASGSKEEMLSNDDEFAAGLAALGEALKLRDKVPQFLQMIQSQMKHKHENHQITPLSPKDEIEKIAYLKLSTPLQAAFANDLAVLHKRLYQVQM